MKHGTKAKKIRIGRVGEIVLATIATAGILSVALFAPNALQMFTPFMKRKKRAPKQEIQRNLESFIASGLVKRVIADDGTPSLILTKKGHWEVLLRHRQKDSGEKQKWDGRWRVIVFDVPNEKSTIRAELRRAIRLYGLHLLQKSVWVYPYPCDDFVQLLRSHLDISAHVLYMTVDTIENDKELRREFNVIK